MSTPHISLLYTGNQNSPLDNLKRYIDNQLRIIRGQINAAAAGSGGSGATTQFMWVVGGPSNFASLPGSPTPPAATATTLVNSALANVNVRMWRNGFIQFGQDPGNSNSFYTKTKSSSTVTFSALQTGDEIIIETIPA